MQKSTPKSGWKDILGYKLLPLRAIKDLENKTRILLPLVSGFQEFMARKLSPPSGKAGLMAEPDPEPALPEEVELAQVAAAMLYDSLGSVCPNPNHESHNVCFKLGTQESIKVVKQGTKSGIFELRVAFESSTTSQTWFDVESRITAEEGDQFLDKPLPDLMETDSAIQSAVSDSPIDLASMSRQQHQARSRSSHPFSSLRSEHSVENTAHFCLYNHRQQTKELAARLKHSEVCEHYLRYPEARYLEEVSKDDMQTQNLCALVRERLSHRDRIRLARIMAESVLKLNTTEWLRDNLDGKNVLVYNINKNYEPYLKVQIIRPGPSEPSSPGTDRRMSQTLFKLAGILCDIALGARGRRRNDSEEDLYARVKKQLNMGYADVVRECQNMAKMHSPDITTNEVVMTAFYTKVVKSLRELEKSFDVS